MMRTNKTNPDWLKASLNARVETVNGETVELRRKAVFTAQGQRLEGEFVRTPREGRPDDIHFRFGVGGERGMNVKIPEFAAALAAYSLEWMEEEAEATRTIAKEIAR